MIPARDIKQVVEAPKRKADGYIRGTLLIEVEVDYDPESTVVHFSSSHHEIWEGTIEELRSRCSKLVELLEAAERQNDDDCG